MYIMGIAAIIRRALLYVAVNFFAIYSVWFWFTGTLSPSQENITACALNQSIHCGTVLSYGWRGVTRVDTAECLVGNNSSAEIDTVTTFCDPDRKVSRFLVLTIITQVLSVLLWAVLWVIVELVCLQLPTVSSKRVAQGCLDIDNRCLLWSGPNSNSWSSSLSSYHEKRNLRELANKLEVFRKWRQIARDVLHYFMCAFVSMGISCWIWGLGMYSITTKYLLLKGLSIFLKMGGDPNFISKSMNAFKRSEQKEKSTCNVDVEMQQETEMWSKSTSLLIACHLSASTPTEASQLRATLYAALAHFPANQIFVCDNSNELQPPDNTQSVVMDVDPDINYLYIPVGNKSFAFYWTEKYWLPHLQRFNRLPKSAARYLVTIDDDVELPTNFHVELNYLDRDDQIAAVQYQVVPMNNSEGRGSNRPLLNGLQYMEYTALGNVPEKVAPMPNITNITGMLRWCSPLYCSGALAVWRRSDFANVMRNHDSVFHGEDLQMGLLLIGRGDKKRMIACSDQNCIIPTVAPSQMGDFLRQRIKSWELINHVWNTKFFLVSFVKSVLRACKGHQTSAKASLYFLVKGVSLVLLHDPASPLARLLLSIYLLPQFYDNNIGGVGQPSYHLRVPLLLSMLVSLALAYSRSFVYHTHNKRHVKSYQQPFMREWMFLPLYGAILDATSYLAGIYNLTFYGHKIPDLSMKQREKFGIVPPCPLVIRPDWNNIWKGPDNSDKEDDTDTTSEDSFQTVNLV